MFFIQRYQPATLQDLASKSLLNGSKFEGVSTETKEMLALKLLSQGVFTQEQKEKLQSLGKFASKVVHLKISEPYSGLSSAIAHCAESFPHVVYLEISDKSVCPYSFSKAPAFNLLPKPDLFDKMANLKKLKINWNIDGGMFEGYQALIKKIQVVVCDQLGRETLSMCLNNAYKYKTTAYLQMFKDAVTNRQWGEVDLSMLMSNFFLLREDAQLELVEHIISVEGAAFNAPLTRYHDNTCLHWCEKFSPKLLTHIVEKCPSPQNMNHLNRANQTPLDCFDTRADKDQMVEVRELMVKQGYKNGKEV